MGNYEIGYPRNDKNPTGKPLKTQSDFHKSDAKYRLLSGGFATGKTTSLILETIKEIFKYNNNYILLGRKDLFELRSTTLKELLDTIPEQLIVSHDKQLRMIRFVNGTELYYMNLDDARKASDKIKSLNLGTAVIDQLEELEETVFLSIVGRLRRENSSRNFIATCNPEGHNWLWDRWKNNPVEGFALFEATTLENIYLPEDYVKELLNYPERWVKRYVYGSWEDWEGSVFSEYVEMKHKIPRYEPNDFEYRYIIVDYGYRNPTAVLFISVDYDGVCRVYDEIYEAGLLIPEIINRIRERKNWQKARRLIDPTTTNVQRDGRSVSDEFMLNGMYMQPADNDVIQGINRVNYYFKQDKLLICENCTNTLREIGKYHWKQLKPNQIRNDFEEPVKKDDHTMDALRYFINYIYLPQKKLDEKRYTLGVKLASPRKSLADF
jgi:PBSX family phage terminase large subunit